MGLGYRWLLDFARLLVVTPRGAKYVLVMLEHFHKWIELVALNQNSTELAATFFGIVYWYVMDHQLRY